MELRPVTVAKRVLSLPIGPNFNELSRMARAYIDSLSPDEYEKLKAEALLGDGSSTADAFSEQIDLLRDIGFTEREIQAYGRMRINSPGLRGVIARRALLMKTLEISELPPDTTFYDVARMENRLLADTSPEQALRELGVSPAEEQFEELLEEDIREAAMSELRRKEWAARRGRATRLYIREHPELLEEYQLTNTIADREFPTHVTKASLVSELKQRVRRRETTAAVRKWRVEHPEEAERIRRKVEKQYGLSHNS